MNLKNYKKQGFLWDFRSLIYNTSIFSSKAENQIRDRQKWVKMEIKIAFLLVIKWLGNVI